MQDLPLNEVLPISASVNDAGRLAIQKRDVREIVEEFGSPLYIFDEATIRGMCREFVDNFRHFYPQTDIEYSTKAFSNPAVLKIIEDEGLTSTSSPVANSHLLLQPISLRRRSTSTATTRCGMNCGKRSMRISVGSQSIRSTRSNC